MTELIKKKKIQKKNRLLDSAYTLFKDKGISRTSISDICSKAGIAKGTFYLYFTDKEDILRALTRKISGQILDDAYSVVNEKEFEFCDACIKMANYLIEYFKSEPDIVRLLRKDFVWPIDEAEFMTTDNPTMSSIRGFLINYADEASLTVHQVLIRMFSVLSMICSVSFSALVDHFPEDIDSMKPEIFAMIKSIFAYPCKQ